MLISNVVFFRNKILVFTLSASTKFILILNRIKQGGAHYLRQKRTRRKKETKKPKKEEKRGEYRHKI